MLIFLELGYTLKLRLTWWTYGIENLEKLLGVVLQTYDGSDQDERWPLFINLKEKKCGNYLKSKVAQTQNEACGQQK